MELYVWYRRPTFKCEDAINANMIFWRINKPLVKPVFLGKLGRFEYKLVDFIVSDTYIQEDIFGKFLPLSSQ